MLVLYQTNSPICTKKVTRKVLCSYNQKYGQLFVRISEQNGIHTINHIYKKYKKELINRATFGNVLNLDIRRKDSGLLTDINTCENL